MKNLTKYVFLFAVLILSHTLVRASQSSELQEKIINIGDLVAKIADPIPDNLQKERVKNLATFVLGVLESSKDTNLNILLKKINDGVAITKPEGRPALGVYFVTLLRMNEWNGNKNTYLDAYSNVQIRKEFEKDVFGAGESKVKRFKDWMFGRKKDVHCAMFERYVIPLIMTAEIPNKGNLNDVLVKDYQNFIAQLFILAQQDGSTTCWYNAIREIMNIGYERGLSLGGEKSLSQVFFFEAMANSALINYVTLYKLNKEAVKIEASIYGKAKEKVQKYYRELISMKTSWRYLYFLDEATRVLRENYKDTYKNFIDRLGEFLENAGLTGAEKTSLEKSIKQAIENPSFIQSQKSLFARTSGYKFAIQEAFLGSAMVITLTRHVGETAIAFGVRQAENMLKALGGGVKSAGGALYSRARALFEKIKQLRK